MAQARELGTPLVRIGQEQRLDESADLESASLASSVLPSGLEPLQGSFLSRTFFAWVFPLLQRSARVEQLQSSDLFTLEQRALPQQLIASFMAAWQDEVARRRRRGAPREGMSVLKVMWRLYVPSMWLLWLGRVVEVALEFVWPLALNLLLNFAADESQSRWLGFSYALLLFLSSGLLVLVENNVNIGMQSLGLRIRCCLITAIFRKVMLLRQDAMQRFSSGTLNNLITTDVDKVRRSLRYVHLLLFAAPAKLVVSLFALHKLMGAAIWISLIWMAVVILLNPVIMWAMSTLQDTVQSRTDERVRRATEVISAIQVVKCYAWEEPSTAKVEESRRLELLSMWRLYSVYTVIEGIWCSVVPIATAVMFAAYSMLYPEDPLTAAKAFTAMELLDMLQEPLFTIPWVLSNTVEALVAGKRMERLFLLPEAHLPATAAIASFVAEEGAEKEEPEETDMAVDFEKANFAWPLARREGEEEEGAAERAEFKLADIDLKVKSGALVAVVGATASGKTSLLQAALGEMPAGAEGRAVVRRSRPIAFAPQQPWIFNGTVRQNILFGEVFQEQRYRDCLRCCDLEKDLELLKDGDMTKVGEKGIALSGGQKARVCLARAAYRQPVSGVFLLDDPYSALDAHVAKKVHEEAVHGLLAKKTRIVATNRLEFVSSCDMVVVLEGGKIEAVGSFEEVRQASEALRGLMEAQGLDTASTSSSAEPQQLERALSYKSSASAEEGGEEGSDGEGAGAAEDEEERASGQVSRAVVMYYLRSIGGPMSWIFLSSLYLSAEGAQLAMPVWLAHWTTSSRTNAELNGFLLPYVALSLAVVFMMTVRHLMSNVYGFRAARRLHAAMLAAVLRAPMSFFQDTPQGRIITRFSKDMHEIDQDLVWNVLYTFVPVINILGSFAMVGVTSVFSTIIFVPLLWLYYKLWKYYNKAVLDMKRLSKTMSSPVYDHFSNLCRENAVSVVRALRQADKQCSTNEALLCEQQRTEYSMIFTENWFSMRMDHLSCILVFAVTVIMVLGRGTFVSAGSAALALTFSFDCSSSIQSMIGMFAEFGMAFNCVERVREYCTTLPSEAPALTDHRPPANWPSRGELNVSNLQLRYRPGLPLVLKGISFSLKPGERLGVCGRTGAGKSSLLLALLRIAEPEPCSRILLDGEDLSQLGLRDVRSNIAMIPQEPVLFQASLRYNCDPFGSFSAEQVWSAVEEAQLAPWLRERSPSATEAEMLETEIKEGGQNLSAGQRQMVAIARAVLRRAKLVVLDEATAAVDAATDAAIQLAVRRCFAGATTLTIAHRLQTIADSDRVMVLAEGEIAELGPPRELKEKEGGIYKSMAEEAE